MTRDRDDQTPESSSRHEDSPAGRSSRWSSAASDAQARGALGGRLRFGSLRSRLVVTSLAVSLLLLGLSLGTNWALLRHEAHTRAEESLDSIVALVAYSVAAGLDFDSRESVREALTGVFRIEEIRFAAVSKPDGSLYESLGDWPADCVRPQTAVIQRPEISWHKGFLIAHAPIRDNSSQYIGTLHVGYSLDKVEAGLHRALFVLLLAGLLLVLIGAAATRRLGARLTAPILELAAAARSVAEGRFQKPLEIRNEDEVGIVARSFNEMTARVEDSRREIERQNRELEQKVRERTTELRQKNLALAMQNEKVMEVSRLKSAFLANMSHELRTPLNAILALSELLRDGIMGPMANDEQVKQVGMIHDSGENLLRLINDVLDLSKIEAGKMEIHYEETDVQEVLRNSLEQLSALARSKGLEFRTSFSAGSRVWADSDRIRQVVLNLVGNAIKFTEHGFVEVSSLLDAQGETLEVSIRDTGIGIAAEDQQRIFQEFRQVDGSASRRFGGTGLGLAICRRLIELMGGEIAVTSKVGAGSAFSFRIPVYRTKPQVAPARTAGIAEDAGIGNAVGVLAPTASLTAGYPRGHGYILVVDDDETVLETLLRYLTRKGFDVHVAHNGFEALRELEERRPDLMILDLMMPGMTGFEVIDRLRHEPDRPKVPVLVYTAKELSRDEWTELQGSVVRILHKGSAGVRMLVENIQRLLAESGSTESSGAGAANPDAEREAA